jgi:hypothetical protein
MSSWCCLQLGLLQHSPHTWKAMTGCACSWLWGGSWAHAVVAMGMGMPRLASPTSICYFVWTAALADALHSALLGSTGGVCFRYGVLLVLLGDLLSTILLLWWCGAYVWWMRAGCSSWCAQVVSCYLE